MTKDKIIEFAKSIANQNNIKKIILYNNKITPSGDILSFKLCIIIDKGDTHSIERSIYMSHDLSVPYDVLVYTKDEWDNLCKEPYSFACRIEKMGSIIYG